MTLLQNRSRQLEHSKNLSKRDRFKQGDEFTVDFRSFIALVYSIMHDDEPDEVKFQTDALFPFDPDHRFPPAPEHEIITTDSGRTCCCLRHSMKQAS